MKNTYRCLFAASIVLTSSFCFSQDAQAVGGKKVPDYITNPPSCGLVFSVGEVNAFSDSKASLVWKKFTDQAVNEMFNHMTFDRLKVIKFSPPKNSPDDLAKLITQELVKTKCNLFIQLSSLASIDVSGKYVKFEASVTHAGLNAQNGNITIVGDYAKEYKYQITDKLLNSFYPGEFAEVVYADLLKTKILSTLH